MTTRDDIRDAERAASYDTKAPVAIAYALIAIAKELQAVRELMASVLSPLTAGGKCINTYDESRSDHT